MELYQYLRNALKENDLSVTDITKKLGKDYTHKTGHWFRLDAGGSFPSKQDWIKLKKILNFDDSFDYQMITEYKELQGVKRHPIGKNLGDVFISPTAKSSDPHFAIFPDNIPEMAIKSKCPENGIVLDPFMDFGTTGKVA